jgi:hypothetical protein
VCHLHGPVVTLHIDRKCHHKSFVAYRLVEEIKDKCNDIILQPEEVYMATTFSDFVGLVVEKGRGGGAAEFTYDAVSFKLNSLHTNYQNHFKP